MLNENIKHWKLELVAHRLKRKIDWYYHIMIFHETGRYFETIACKKAKDVEKTLRNFADIFKIPVYIAYYWIDRKREKPRNITNNERWIKKDLYL